MLGKAGNRASLAGCSEDSLLQSFLEADAKNTEYGFLWMAPLMIMAKCCQKPVISLGERWAFCRGHEADLDTGDES